MDIAKHRAIWNSVRVFPRKWWGNGMVVRDEIPGNENHNINQWFDKMARAPMLCLRVFSFGFTLLAASIIFDARPAMAQYIGVGPFGVYLGGGHRYHGGGYYHRHSITTFIIILTVILLIDTAIAIIAAVMAIMAVVRCQPLDIATRLPLYAMEPVVPVR